MSRVAKISAQRPKGSGELILIESPYISPTSHLLSSPLFLSLSLSFSGRDFVAFLPFPSCLGNHLSRASLPSHRLKQRIFSRHAEVTPMTYSEIDFPAAAASSLEKRFREPVTRSRENEPIERPRDITRLAYSSWRCRGWLYNAE